MKIRRVTTSDSDDLYEIHSFPQVNENTSQLLHLSPERVETFFNNPHQFTLVAEADGKVCGFVALILTSKMRDRHVASVAIALHPDFQGKGIGKALMIEVIEQADKWLNLVRLELEVHADNLSAVALYEKVGFSTEGVKKLSSFKNGQYIDMLLMARINPKVEVNTAR